MAQQSWLRTYVPRPRATAQLICFPHAGGAASAFRGWADALPESVELVSVQYPGRQDRMEDPPAPDIATLADQISTQIAARLDRPTALFGHSMGATVAFEVARRLSSRYLSLLACLFVSACDAPQTHQPRGLAVGDDKIREYVRLLGGTAANLLDDEEIWQLMLPALRQDFALIDGYRYQPGAPLSCPVTAITGADDPTATLADVSRWRELTIGRFEAHELPGGHFYFDGALPQLARLLADWDTGAERRRTPIPDLVARQAAATPEAAAVVDDKGELSYRDLERISNQLAHLLRERGAGPGRPVGVRLPRSRNMVIALLAAWKAGAAYVPLDADSPRSRTEMMLADSDVGVLLVDEEGAVGVNGDVGVDVPGVAMVPLDRDLRAAAGYPTTRPDDGPTGGHPAYVLYTSGSTGRPKGVLISHEGIANCVRWRIRNHRLTADDRILQKTPLIFDAAGWEVFAPLVSGAAVVLAPLGAERDPAAMVAAVARHGVTVLQVVPSVLRVLVEEADWSGCTRLRVLSSGGEPLHAELAQRFLRVVEEAAGDVEVWNTYGPTECSIDVTAYRFDPLQRAGAVAIGTPVDGMRMLLDDDGELCIGGVGVALGYLGRPALTAQRFVPDPAGPPGSRVYRTGDRCRWRADGNLEYIGRIDHQVKIDGVRIEPGEVAAVLAGHPDVLDCVVTSYRAATGTTRLAAYVRPRLPGTSAGLADYLRGWLPASHVPAAFVELDRFPTTPSGKTDLLALPPVNAEAAGQDVGRLGVDGAGETGDGGEASGAAADLVAKVWQELLGVERVGARDDFFRLGGSSLQLVRLANRLQAVTGRDVGLAPLLSATTVAAQARLLGPVGEVSPLHTVSRADGLPLSFGQHRLWLLDKIGSNRREWVSGLFVPIAPGTGEASVQSALDRLVARHEALRTRFVVEAGQPVQRIDPVAEPMAMRVVDADWGETVAILDREAERGFDLARGPLARALLVRRPGGEQTLVLLVHHIACDGWSSAILDRELQQILAAERAGTSAELPALPVQYADFAVWQRARLTDEVLAPDLEYWRSTLEGATPLGPPADHPRPRQRDGRGAVVSFGIPASLTRALTELGRNADATPFMTLLTAFATLLARHTDQWDIPVGTPTAGRDRPELEGVVGFFLNSLVLRCRLAADQTFEQALDGVRNAGKEALAHQQLPFDRLVVELAPDRDPSRTPFYQVAFDFHDAELTGAPQDPAALAGMVEASRVAKTDLTLYLRRQPDGSMTGLLEYATALFEHDSVVRLARRFQTLLRSVVAAPRTRLDTLEFLPDDELRALDLSSHEPALPGDESVLAMVERQVAVGPGDVAVVAGTVSTTFAELDARAVTMAAYLHTLGVGPESVVGVLLERDVHLLVTLLAVWKAGGAYLPLDPATPALRVTEVLADAGASVLVTTADVRRRLDADHDGLVSLAEKVLLAESVPARPADQVDPDDPEGQAGEPGQIRQPVAAAAASRLPDPDQLAYVIYTSGSTGRPKGVAVTHGGLANHIRWAVAELAGRGRGGAALFSSVAFDLVVPNLWAPLVAGRPLHLMPPDLDLTELGERLVAEAPFGFLKLTPGHLEVLDQQVGSEYRADLADVIVVAGEALPPALADRWAADLGDGRLVNEYGPTETSVGATTFAVRAPVGRGSVPIGRPLPGVSARVLDGRFTPMPIGTVGELHVGGAGVARGYLHQPALTAERFVPDPYGPPGARMYRSGDLVRVLAGGDLDFVGRRDVQVKIRGYRVEPGEVRGVLCEHPAVRDAVVVAQADALIAYYVPNEVPNNEVPGGASRGVPDGVTDEPVSPGALAEYCSARLPSYLVPAVMVPIDRVPLTANGKLDHAALPAAPVPELVEPRGVIEVRVADMFAELLGRSVGAHTHFLSSGGNSIIAIRLVAAIQAEFDIDLTVRVVFENGTVAELAAVVEAELRAEFDRISDDELVAVTRQVQEDSVQ